MSGPSQGSPVGEALWKENDQSRDAGALGDEPRRLEQLVHVGSPASTIRLGSECAVKTTCASSRPRARSASRAIKPGSVPQRSTKRSLGPSRERLD